MPTAKPHARFEKRLTLDAETISAFATLSGDTNPLHHDAGFARSRGYESVTACGAQSSSILMSLIADQFSKIGPMVGLQFEMFFKNIVPADKPITIQWLVIRSIPKPKIDASLVELRGRLLVDGLGTAVGAKGKVLLYGSSAG